MFERFTERARQVIILAKDESTYFNHGYIGTEHLLAGLCAEEDGLASRALFNLGIDHALVRKDIFTVLGTGLDDVPSQPPFTPRLKKVLELALREALSLGHSYIGTEHILLALVREHEGLGMRILKENGVDIDAVHTQVMQILNGPPRKSKAKGFTPALAFNEEEQEINDNILNAMQGLNELGLAYNRPEMVQAVHTLQHFVIQHMLQRLAPGEWGDWFAKEPS